VTSASSFRSSVIARSVNRSAVLAVEVKGQRHPELPRGVELEALRDGDLGELDGGLGPPYRRVGHDGGESHGLLPLRPARIHGVGEAVILEPFP
jgi:hypothetical protein